MSDTITVKPMAIAAVNPYRSAAASGMESVSNIVGDLASSSAPNSAYGSAAKYNALVDNGLLQQAIDGAQAVVVSAQHEASIFNPQIQTGVVQPLQAVQKLGRASDASLATLSSMLYAIRDTSSIIARHLDPLAAAVK